MCAGAFLHSGRGHIFLNMSQRKFVPLPADSEERMTEGRKEILILRGPSGSGKSTLGKRLFRTLIASSHASILN